MRTGVLAYLQVFHRLEAFVPYLPAALLLLFSGGAGTFFEGAQGGWALAGHLALLIFVGAFGDVPDPLRLGRAGQVLLIAFAVSVIASHLASPVMRAGRLGVVLLLAFALVPSAVARCWSSDRARHLGLRSISLVVIAIAGWSLLGWHSGTSGASLPLGHENLLAAWLLLLLPLAVLPWRDGRAGRVIAVVAGALGLVSLVGTRSLAAACTVCLFAVVITARGRRRWLGLATIALVAASQLPRLGSILSGADTSVAARWSYLQAGWRGLLERPVLGWGPGATPWTLAEHLRPIPGIHVPDQLVGDVHSLPLLIGYELGWSGLLLISGLVLLFLRRRPDAVADPALRRAALLGLTALAIMSCAGRPMAAAAVPLAAMLGIGAVLAAESPSAGRGKRRVMVCAATAMTMAVVVVPLDLAHLAYDRAVRADRLDLQAHHLRRAVELDPEFPLYRARLAWLEADRDEARAAAERAVAVAPLWSVAGMLAQEAGEVWSREALLRACRLSPLGVIAPYRLTLGEKLETTRFSPREDNIRAQWAARALLAEPLVLAAVAWRDQASMVHAAVDEIGRLDGIGDGWHTWLEQSMGAWGESRLGSSGPSRVMALEMDENAATSVSLYAFRRRPWPIDLARIEIDAGILATIDFGTAAPLPRAAAGDGGFLQDELCGLRWSN